LPLDFTFDVKHASSGKSTLQATTHLTRHCS
jgi:hypothetical protein